MRPLRQHKRAGLTLVELLVALAIIAILAGITIPIIATILSGDRVRNASFAVQTMIAEARQRAAVDGVPRGVRMVPDPNNPEVCRQLIFIREGDPLSSGRCIVTNKINPAYFDTVLIPASELYGPTLEQEMAKGIVSIPRHGINNTLVIRGSIRFESAGKFYGFSIVPALVAATIGGTQYLQLVLDEPLTGPLPTPSYDASSPTFDQFMTGVPNGTPPIPSANQAGLQYQILTPPVALEGADPVLMPRSIVIDYGQLPQTNMAFCDPANSRLTRLTPRLTQGLVDPQSNALDFGFEIMFAPDGRVMGEAASDDRIIIWLRDELTVFPIENTTVVSQLNGRPRKEISADSSGRCSLVVLNSRTGFLGTFKPVLQDGQAADPLSGTQATGADGRYDWELYYRNVLDNVGVNDRQ